MSKGGQCLVWPPFASSGVMHLLCMELIGQLIVTGGMLVHSSLMTDYCEELELTCINADPEHPNHADWVTCLVWMLAISKLRCFFLPEIVHRSSNIRCWSWLAQEWASGCSHSICFCINNAINEMHLWSLCILLPMPKPNYHHGPPYPHRTSANHSPTRCHAHCENWDTSIVTSPMCQAPSNVSSFPVKSVRTINYSQVETPTSIISQVKK